MNDMSRAGLYRQWARMWNGETALASEIVAEGFRAHLTAESPQPPRAIEGADSVADWVSHIRNRGVGMTYTTEMGPFIDGNMIVAYWRLAGARPAEGREETVPFEKVGMDILRWKDGKFVEYWTMDNNAAS